MGHQPGKSGLENGERQRGLLLTNGLTTFADIAGATSGVVTIASSGVQPGSVTVSNSNTSYTFTGGPITGYTSFTTSGGMTTLAATNSYSGGTYVSSGTLVAAAGDGSLGSASGGLYLDNGGTFATSTEASIPAATYTLPRRAAAPTRAERSIPTA